MYKEIIGYAIANNLEYQAYTKACEIDIYIKLRSNGDFDGIVKAKKKSELDSVPDFDSYSLNRYRANPIVEKAEYILGQDILKKGSLKTLKYKSYRENIADGAAHCESLKAIHAFITKYDSDEEFHKEVVDAAKNAGVTQNSTVSWSINNNEIEKSTDWKNWVIDKMKEFRANGKEPEEIVSALSGTIQKSVPCKSGPALKNTVNRKTLGGFDLSNTPRVVSAKESAFESYGFKQAFGCQFGIDDAEMLAAGLQHLLNSEINNSPQLKQIFFSENNAIEQLIKESMDGPEVVEEEDDDDDDDDDDDNADESPEVQKKNLSNSTLSSILNAVYDGKSPIIDKDLRDERYHIYHFNCLSSRPFISGEITGTYAELAENLWKWYDDTAIDTGKSMKSILKIKSIPYRCVSTRDSKEIHKLVNNEFGSIMSQLISAVYNNTQIPAIFFRRAVRYASLSFVSDKKNDTARLNVETIYAQIIKCYLIRKGYNIMNKVTTDLNKAYACGKLFAVIETLQYKYHKVKEEKLNVSLAEKYFAGAAKSPKRILTPLMKNARSIYLNGIEEKSEKFYSELFSKIVREVGGIIPAKFNLDEQGLFILGYEQQRSELLTKKNVNKKAEQDADR